MEISNKLASLVKREKSEEEKLLIDLDQGIKKLKEACKKRTIKIKDFRTNLNGSLGWFDEAKKRIIVVEKIAQEIKTQGFSKANYRSSGIKAEEQVVLASLENAERDVGGYIKQIKSIRDKYWADKYIRGSNPYKGETLKDTMYDKYIIHRGPTVYDTVDGDTLKDTQGVLASMELFKENIEKLIALHNKLMAASK